MNSIHRNRYGHQIPRPLRLWADDSVLITLMASRCRPAACQSAPAIPKEKIEWMWSVHSGTLDLKLPNVLLVGDSIIRSLLFGCGKLLSGPLRGL